MHILVVEDERSLARVIEVELLLQSYSVEVCHDGKSALARALDHRVDLIVLDWMLPDIEGIQVCRVLRSRGSQVPIIMITAKQGISSEVRSLSEGADDHIEKPFDMEQLVARIKAVARRSARGGEMVHRTSVGSVTIEPDTRAVYDDGQRVHLTNKEYAILALLVANRGKVTTKDEIRRCVWGESTYLEEGAIAVHVKAIRDKLKGVDIENVRGVGYLIRQTA